MKQIFSVQLSNINSDNETGLSAIISRHNFMISNFTRIDSNSGVLEFDKLDTTNAAYRQLISAIMIDIVEIGVIIQRIF